VARTIVADAVVIGSGAGGSVAFRELARSGGDVVMVEEGPRLAAAELPDGIADRTALTYRSGGLQPILGSPVIPFGEGRLLGGSTEINGGLLWRTPEWILQDWRARGLFEDLTVDDLDSIAGSIERDLTVALTPHLPGTDIDSEILRRGAADLGWHVSRVPRATPGCERANLCASVCPTGAKRSMSLTYIPAGEAAGGRVQADVRITRLRSRDRRIVSAEGVDTRSGEGVELRAARYFLAAGALHSPRLLATAGSRLPRSAPLGLHLNAKVIGVFPEPVNAERSTIFTWQVQEFMREGMLIMPANLRPEYLAMATSGATNDTVRALRRDYANIGLFTTQIRPSGYGRILMAAGRSVPLFHLAGPDVALLARSVLRTVELLFNRDATRVYLPIAGVPAAHSLRQARALISAARPGEWQVTSVHAMSSMPAGLDASLPVDPAGRVRALDNLWAVDASALPTTVGESPQGSIMLLASATMRRLLDRSALPA
jgi:choline dehydrogenase-like flavoprotein